MTVEQQLVEDLAAAAAAVVDANATLDASVIAARRAGASWRVVGEATGRTRQTAHERWGRVVDDQLGAELVPRLDNQRAGRSRVVVGPEACPEVLGYVEAHRDRAGYQNGRWQALTPSLATAGPVSEDQAAAVQLLVRNACR